MKEGGRRRRNSSYGMGVVYGGFGSWGFFMKHMTGSGRGWPDFMNAPDLRMNRMRLSMPLLELNRGGVGQFSRSSWWYT
jgi:hypothetical protein